MLSNTFNRLLQRKDVSHKYDYGHVLVLGGSPGMRGAAVLSAHAALRTGAGLVTLATDDISASHPQLWPEIMTTTLESMADLADFCADRKVSVVVIGPGLSPSDLAADQLAWLLSQTDLSIVIDGGALSILPANLTLLNQATAAAVIITPHNGEFERLLDQPLSTKRADQEAAADHFAQKHPVTVVLKGAASYVTTAGEPSYRNRTGNPGLATAGSGDVLSGVIAGIICQGITPQAACAAAVYLHGLSGDLATAAMTQPAVIASDIIEYLGPAYAHIKAKGTTKI